MVKNLLKTAALIYSEEDAKAYCERCNKEAGERWAIRRVKIQGYSFFQIYDRTI